MADLDDCPETGDFFLARIQIDDQHEVHVWGDRNAEPVAELPQDEYLELKRQGLQAFTAWLDQHDVAYEVVRRRGVVYTPALERISGTADDGDPRVVAGDWTTSPAALRVLVDGGVEAWRKWCAEHQPAS